MQPASPRPKSPYANNKALVYTSPILHEALKVLAADNLSKRKKGGNYSALVTQLGIKYATQPQNLARLRGAGFRKLEQLLALR
jgi:hypothetical protein